MPVGMHEGQKLLKRRILQYVVIFQWLFACISSLIYIGKLVSIFAVPILVYPRTLQDVLRSDIYKPFILQNDSFHQSLKVGYQPDLLV